MALKKELFINALQMIEVDDRESIPTAVLFSTSGNLFGYQAIEAAADATNLNENFKLNLGESAPSRLDPPRFETADGQHRSAYEITKVFLEAILKHSNKWVESRGMVAAKRVLVAEPLALDKEAKEASDWLANYRAKLKRIFEPHFKEVDFLPEPFAVFQYYRYGLRHPLLVNNKRHAALVIDFGGGTFDVSVVDTTATGDVSGGGRNSRPLAAASIPVGGSFVNLSVARDLLIKNIEKGIDKQRVAKGWDAYRLGTFQELRDDMQQFVKNARRIMNQIERAKLHICDTLADWRLDASFAAGAPAMQIMVPKNPFAAKPELVPVRFDADYFRDLFVKRLWSEKLKPAISTAIERAKEELSGRPLDIVLLSGGSANIRWLTELLKEFLPTSFPDIEILELQGSFQEVVSKGLAIECARRTFNQGASDFQAVTYNRLCLMLGVDGETPIPARFRPIGDNKANPALKEGTLLESAFLIGDAHESPLRWKFRLPAPPKHHLDYYFLKSSLDFDSISSLHNVDHRVSTPRNTAFDSNILLELTVAADGTAYPNFVYRQGGGGRKQICAEGKPFFLDMTYGERTTLGEAYVGVDFGTSNSSVSYVEQQAVRTYAERASDKGWRELSDLVNVLPFPASNAVAKFLGSASESEIRERFAAAFESLLFVVMAIALADYRATPASRASNIFKQFDKGSAGPIWAVLRALTDKNSKDAIFLPNLGALRELRTRTSIDAAIDAINDHKHHRNTEYRGHREVLATLGNALVSALGDWRFGQFDEVRKKGFGVQHTGICRIAQGAHSPFVEILSYVGAENFSNMEAVLVSPEQKKVLKLEPLMFWTVVDGEHTVAMLDTIGKTSVKYRLCAVNRGLDTGSNTELVDLDSMCRALLAVDGPAPLLVDCVSLSALSTS